MPSFKNIRHIEHAAFWAFIYLFVFDYHFLENNWAEAIGRTLLEVLTYAAIAYLNLLVFIPYLLMKKRNAAYLLAMVTTVVGYVAIMRWSGMEGQFYEMGGWRNAFSMVLNTSLFLLISTLFWFFKQWQVERERQLVLRSEKLEAELGFLRSQISPHFVFNTLNNIYTLALQKHDNAAPMVAKLSALLRYVLYEGSEGQVLLKKEMETLRQYIELQLLRKPRSTNVDSFAEGSPDAWRITPMLLVNFVENAFKHSHLDQDENAWIKVHSEVGSDGRFVFSVENNTVTHAAVNSESGGIGLQNLRRQLELNYPGRHGLEVKEESGVFRVRLEMQLQA